MIKMNELINYPITSKRVSARMLTVILYIYVWDQAAFEKG